ncbi:plasmid pRiA4b ORF-3 family protein [Labedaea rhizosphaerae]|uniref:PRiA4b ORF-3-like protein n=1 Tax=Labedaea rhizosphaerae TaxID=598644 RepID=A0A4R6SPF7_LABRH|nr:plasmid pRiA4b ORF-3 family protein [Labedaea rhizosphaerae]TDQ05841.1 pRiA4b ORF-3-like protein [Labedaea rhizosphaerae]
MSPTSRKRTKKKRRTTPLREPSISEVFDAMVASFADVVGSPDTLQAELTTSAMLGMWWSTGPAGTETIGRDVVQHAVQVGDANALALLTGVSALATGELAAAAAEAAEELTKAGVPTPPWADSIGAATPGECWHWGDVFGDMETVFCRFGGPMGDHATCVLINRVGSSAFAEDAWVVGDPEQALAEARTALSESADAELLRIEPISQAEARELIRIGFRATDLVPRRVSDTLADYRALVLARARLLPEPTGAAELTAAEQEQLVREFLADAGLDPDGAARRCAARYVEFCSECDTGDPRRVSAALADEFLQDAVESELTPAEIEAMPDVVIAYTRWAATRRGFPDRAIETLMAQVERSAAEFRDGDFGWIDLPSPRKDSYVIRVDLEGSKPPIWRRLRVPGTLTLADLHEVLQVAFDWDGSHLHTFAFGALTAGDPDGAVEFDLDETEVAISQVAPNPGAKLEYVYDHGDNWTHLLRVEKVEPPDADHPIACLDGRRAAPMEDSGGPVGWSAKVAAAADPEHPHHDVVLEWFDGIVPDLEAFDVAAVDAALRARFTEW